MTTVAPSPNASLSGSCRRRQPPEFLPEGRPPVAIISNRAMTLDIENQAANFPRDLATTAGANTFSNQLGSCAVSMKEATSSGWDIITAWLLLISRTFAWARFAIIRCAVGGTIWSSVVTMK